MQTGGGLTGMQGMGLGGMDANQMSQMLSNPMVQQMLSNPAYIEQIINMDPTLKQMVDANP